MRMGGVCLVAMLALGAMLASGAQAGTYYRCNAHKKGKYSESGCKTLDEKKGKPKGGYELEEVKTCVPQKKGKYSESKCETLDEKNGKGKGSFEKSKGLGFAAKTGNLKWAVPDLGPSDIECSESTTVGEITGAKTARERIRLTGCQSAGLPFQSRGPDSTPSGESGVIVTNELDVRLIDHGEKAGGYGGREPAEGEAWEEIVSAEHQPYIAEFEQSGLVFERWSGALSGVVTTNNLSTTSTTEFSELQGEQALLAEASSTGFEGPWSPLLPMTITTTATVRNEVPIELKT